jgi:hypothetical protein
VGSLLVAVEIVRLEGEPQALLEQLVVDADAALGLEQAGAQHGGAEVVADLSVDGGAVGHAPLLGDDGLLVAIRVGGG